MTLRFRSTARTAAAPLLVVLSLGCRSEPAEPKKAGVFPLQPRPVRVTVTRDSGRATTASVPAGGGTLTAAGSDGSRFTLTIPPKALDGDTTITMTPISAIAGLPLSGGLVAAVHLEPEGLRFNLPALLRIEPAREVPVQQQVGFGYLGGGSDFHMYPLDRGRGVAMRLLHFSGAGVASGTQADISALRQRPPADAAAQLEQQIADLIKAQREAGLEGSEADPEFSTKLTKLLRDFYDNVVVPKLDDAGRTDDWRVMFDAVQTAMSFIRLSIMVGEDQSAYSKLLPIMEPVLVHAFDRAKFRCLAKIGGDKDAIMLMIIARHAALTTFEVDPNDWRFSQAAIDQCAAGGTVLPDSLELSFEATFEFHEADGTTALMTVGSTAKLDQVAGSTTYTQRGWAPVVYRDFQFTAQPGCRSYTDVVRHDGQWRMSLFVHPDGKIGLTWMFNALDGIPWEQMTIVPCPGGGGHRRPTHARWWSVGLQQLNSFLLQESPPGYVGLQTGMTFSPAPGILSATIERTDFHDLFQKGVITLGLKVLP